MPPGTKKFTTIFFATEPHTSEKTFRKYINAGNVYKVDVIMLCGDLTAKIVISIIDQNDNSSQCNLFAQDSVLRTDKEIKQMKETIGRMFLRISHYSSRNGWIII
jgi:Icc-related predicted phosphoesterase